ncbi:MAG: hypothetical protein M0P01_00420 [Treponema sp.]|nr:hypothetical protein [Treponema sp.]
MRTKKNIGFYVFLSILFCIAYIILAAHPLTTEYQFIPEWKIDINAQSISSPDPAEKPLYFHLGQTMGYFTGSGKIISLMTFPFKATISDSYFTSYTADSSSVKFYHADGSDAGTIEESGFPLFEENRIFVFLPGGSSIVQCNQDGSKNWQYGGTVPITAFDSSEAGCIVGFADGTVREISKYGKTLQEFVPGGSDYSVILGAALSSDGQTVATVSGQGRQRFVLAKKDGTHTKIIFHEFVGQNDPHQRLVQFSRDNNIIWYNFNGGLGIVDSNGRKHSHIPVKGQAISLQEAGNMVFLLTKQNKTYTVYAIEKFNTLCGSFSFDAGSAFIRTDGNNLFVGKDTTISRITLEKK